MRDFFSSRTGIFLLGFAAIGGYFLITEHSAHVIQFLPWILLAACPLMHLFVHHGSGHDHGRHHGHAVGDKANHADKGPSTQIATHASVPETAPPNDQSR